jgi:hypothetical protein
MELWGSDAGVGAGREVIRQGVNPEVILELMEEHNVF